MQKDPLETLGLGQLAFFVGQRLNEMVLAELRRAGHDKVRMSHGYLIQHLVEGDRSIGELARRMGVTQQAASKAIAELSTLGYVKDVPGEDARERRVGLSARGREMLSFTRKTRQSIETSLLRGIPKSATRRARLVLVAMLERLAGADAVRARRVPEPDGRSG